MSSNQYRFEFSGNTITKIEKFDDGRWEIESPDANEQWTYDSVNNVVTETETEHNYTEVKTYTDSNNDGIYLKSSGEYTNINGTPVSNSDDLYRFEFSGSNVTKVEEFENGTWRIESMDSNETWQYDSNTNTVTKTETEHGLTKTYTFTDTDSDGVFLKASSTYDAGSGNQNIIHGSFDLSGSDNDDYLESYDDDDYLSGGDGDDYFNSGLGDDDIDGGAGTDTLMLSINQADLTNISKKKFGGYHVSSSEGDDDIINIEELSFLDGTETIDGLLANKAAPIVTFNGNSVNAESYAGPVDYLEYVLYGEADDDISFGSHSNDFINLLDGNDAADGGDGDDVLDGGRGSNFLQGGNGDDTFFLDGRSGEITWSTITDFSSGSSSTSGDNVNIWGWEQGVSQLLSTEENAGAEGYKGLTLHYDLDNDGTIDTSITFTGVTNANDLTVTSESIGSEGYLLVA